MTENLYDDICNYCGGSGHSPDDKGECPVCNGYGKCGSDDACEDRSLAGYGWLTPWPPLPEVIK